VARLLDGEIQVATARTGAPSGGVGLLVEFAPGERHEVIASADARLLLLPDAVARPAAIPARMNDP